MTTTFSLETLVQRAKAGEHEAFAALYARYDAPIRKYLGRWASGPEVEDLAQETWTKAWQALPKTNPDTERLFQAWLYRIAMNKAIDAHSHAKLLQWTPWATYVAVPHPAQVAPERTEDGVLRRETREEVRATLAKLTPRHRRILVAVVTLGESYAEIGARLGLTRWAVKSLLRRARHAYRVAVAVDSPAPPRRAANEHAAIYHYRDGRRRPYQLRFGPLGHSLGSFTTCAEAEAARAVFAGESGP